MWITENGSQGNCILEKRDKKWTKIQNINKHHDDKCYRGKRKNSKVILYQSGSIRWCYSNKWAPSLSGWSISHSHHMSSEDGQRDMVAAVTQGPRLMEASSQGMFHLSVFSTAGERGHIKSHAALKASAEKWHMSLLLTCHWPQQVSWPPLTLKWGEKRSIRATSQDCWLAENFSSSLCCIYIYGPFSPLKTCEQASQDSYPPFTEEETKPQRDEMAHPNSGSWQDAEPGLAKLNPSFLCSGPYSFLKINWVHKEVRARAY